MIRNLLVAVTLAGLLAWVVGCEQPAKKDEGKTVKPATTAKPAAKETAKPAATVTPAAKETAKPAAPAPAAAAKVAGLPEGKPVVNKAALVAVPMTAAAVTLDGKLDDPAWKNAAALSGFVSDGKKLASPDARVLVTYDKDNLYVAVINFEPKTDKLTAKVKETDGPVWSEDCDEVHVDAKDTEGDFFGFFVNPINTRYDRRKSESWDGKGQWKSATSVMAGKAWVSELAIPFKTLGVTPKAGTKLGLMVARDISTTPEHNTFYLVDCRDDAKDTSRYVEMELK